MSFLFGGSPDTGGQQRLEQASEGAYGGANPNVGLVNFGQSAATTGALPAAISGYQSILNSKSGFAPQEQAVLQGARTSAAQEAAANIQGDEQQRERSGMGSSGEEEAQQALAESDAATKGSAAGTEAAAVGAQSRLGALGGETAAGGTQAAAEDRFTMAAKETAQQQMQQNFMNALAKAGGLGGLMKGYSGTQAGGGYGLLGQGLLGSALGQNATGQMAGAASGGIEDLISMLG